MVRRGGVMGSYLNTNQPQGSSEDVLTVCASIFALVLISSADLFYSNYRCVTYNQIIIYAC